MTQSTAAHTTHDKRLQCAYMRMYNIMTANSTGPPAPIHTPRRIIYIATQTDDSNVCIGHQFVWLLHEPWQLAGMLAGSGQLNWFAVVPGGQLFRFGPPMKHPSLYWLKFRCGTKPLNALQLRSSCLIAERAERPGGMIPLNEFPHIKSAFSFVSCAREPGIVE